MNYPLVLLTLFVYTCKLCEDIRNSIVSWMVTLALMYVSPHFYIARLMLNIPLHVPLGIIAYKAHESDVIIPSMLTATLSFSFLCMINLVLD